MSTPFRLHVPRQLYQELLNQALAELPNECCGLLAGHLEKSADPTLVIGKVVRRYPLVNDARSPSAFCSEPRSMFAAERDLRQHNLEILAVYHSHPTTKPIPSIRDREQNYSPSVVSLIMSLTGPQPAVQCWWLSAETYVEAAWEIVDEAM